MPIEHHFNSDQNLCILKHVGAVSDESFLDFYQSFLTNDQFAKSMNFLVDLSQTDSAERSSKALRQFAKLMQQIFINTEVGPKVAVIAPTDISFGLARMYERLTDSVPWEFVVFRDTDSALTWLGISRDLLNHLAQNGIPEST